MRSVSSLNSLLHSMIELHESEEVDGKEDSKVEALGVKMDMIARGNVSTTSVGRGGWKGSSCCYPSSKSDIDSLISWILSASWLYAAI